MRIVHNKEIFKCVVIIAHEDEDMGNESIGSGVLIAWQGRHLIATAAHCIRRNPRVLRDTNFYHDDHNRMATSPPVRILGKWLHPTSGYRLSGGRRIPRIGAEPRSTVLRHGAKRGVAHHRPSGVPDRNRRAAEAEMTLGKSVFTTEIIEQTDE